RHRPCEQQCPPDRAGPPGVAAHGGVHTHGGSTTAGKATKAVDTAEVAYRAVAARAMKRWRACVASVFRCCAPRALIHAAPPKAKLQPTASNSTVALSQVHAPCA